MFLVIACELVSSGLLLVDLPSSKMDLDSFDEL